MAAASLCMITLMSASGCQLLNPTKPSPEPGSVTPTVVSPEPEATPTVVSPEPEATPSEEPTPTVKPPASPKAPPSKPKASPNVNQVLDVSAFDYIEFASPSGRLVCGIFSGAAHCFLPPGFQGKVPSSAKACSDPDFTVNAVSVESGKATWYCFNDLAFWPSKGSPGVEWHAQTDYGWVKSGFGDQKLASLPYGVALQHKNFSCSSATDGVRCWNHKTEHGFQIRLAGVKFW